MKRNLIFVTILALALTGSAFAGEEDTFGDGVTVEKAVAVETLLANPSDYMGETIRVDGIITGVCKMRGCWIQVSDEKGNGVRVKVEDGVIVFPATSMGQKASAQGVFDGVPVAIQEEKHQQHKEEGAKHEACDAKPQGEMVYFIKGTGAVIYS